ncbi:tail fiber domain-containing protein [Aquimarina sp. D1M17]|uniref:tail fiber domain-containing protein n=1 Tax=Aquimarina acroporae TaxID=2937283 RepID=UPI0020BD94D3|nr:tail fiber domain-containing protein [Aquimarina acroporae]MCK8522611.1 tail fiber domain-containing protein [Aquimarina acroporae]
MKKADVILTDKEVHIEGDLRIKNGEDIFIEDTKGQIVTRLSRGTFHLGNSSTSSHISVKGKNGSTTVTDSYVRAKRLNASNVTSVEGQIKDLKIFGWQNEEIIPGKIVFKGKSNKDLLIIDPVNQDIVFQDGSTLKGLLGQAGNSSNSGASSGQNTSQNGQLKVESIQYENGNSPAQYLFEGGTSNADKMVLAHSKRFKNWGLRYKDSNDSFHFDNGGKAVMSVLLAGKRVGIGVENPTHDLQVNGSVAGTQAYKTLSDGTFKQNVETIRNPLAAIEALNGVTYDWNAKAKQTKNVEDKKQYGFVAQEVEKVIPELAFTDAKGEKSLNYQGLLPILVEAIKEQQQMISRLESKIAKA